MSVRTSVVLWWLASGAGCSHELEGDACPVATPNGRDGVLYFENAGYVQDGLYKHVVIPTTIPAHQLVIEGKQLVFHPPSCELDDDGNVVRDDNGVARCQDIVTLEPTSTTCTFPELTFKLADATVDVEPHGNNIVDAVTVTDAGIDLKVRCDVSLSGTNDVRVVVRDPRGRERYADTIWVTCVRATTFRMNFDGIAGQPPPPPTSTVDGVVRVGDEFYVRYRMVGTHLGVESSALMGQGMLPAGIDPAFEVVGYENFPLVPMRLHLRALRPAVRPMLVAGTMAAEVPVTIEP